MLVKEYKDELLNDILTKFNCLKTEVLDIDERVTSLEKDVTELKNMQCEIQILKAKIKQQQNQSVFCELRINEIPFIENENVVMLTLRP